MVNSFDVPSHIIDMASYQSSSKQHILKSVEKFEDDKEENVKSSDDTSSIFTSHQTNISLSEDLKTDSESDKLSMPEQTYFNQGFHVGNSEFFKQTQIQQNSDLQPCFSDSHLEISVSQDSTDIDTFVDPDIDPDLDLDSMSISSLETMGTTSLLSRLMEQTHFHRFDRLSEDDEEIVSSTNIDGDGVLVNSYCSCNHAKSIWCSRHQDFMEAITKMYRNEKNKLPSGSVPVVAGLIAAQDYGLSSDLACPQCVCSLRNYNINNSLEDKQEQLLDAIRHHDIRIVKDILINGNINPNFKLNKKNPICKAVCMGNLEIISMLIDAGADLNTSNQADTMWDRKPVHIAACRGDFASLELLVQRGADINHRDSDERTPLHWVAMYGHSHLIAWMIKFGADTSAAQQDGFTALHTATCLGHAAVCRELLAGGALLTEVDTEGWTPLHTSVCYGNIAVIRLLLHQPDCPINAVTISGDSLLHIACSKGRVDIIDLVLEQGISLEKQNRQGATALHTAVLCRRVHATLCLIRCGANVNAVDNQGVCPAYMAAIRGEVEILRLLVSAGCYLPHGIHRPLRKLLPTSENILPSQSQTSRNQHPPLPQHDLNQNSPSSQINPHIEHYTMHQPIDQPTNDNKLSSAYHSTEEYTQKMLQLCVEHLQRMEGQPLNLITHCLHAIRQSLAPRLHLKTCHLPVPPSVQRAISMETLNFAQIERGKSGDLTVVSMDSNRPVDREEFLNELVAQRVELMIKL